MMREIKFRGLSDSGWVHGHLTGFEDSVYIQVAKTRADGGNVGHIENYLEQFEVDPSTVGQFIGITDSDCVDIYEGDNVLGLCDGEKEEWTVTFEDDRDMNGWNVVSQDVENGLEVIGNIYETIKEGKE